MARNKGLVAAMEEELAVAEAEQQEGVNPELLLETGDNQEEGLAEMASTDAEVDAEVDGIEEGQADSETLENIQGVMEDSIETGGLDETSAQIAEVAIESIRARLGMKKKSIMPAMESFGAKGDRVAATKLAMESVGSVLKTVWEAIKKAIARMSEVIVSFVKALFSGTERIKQRVAKVRAAADAVKGKTATKNKVEAGGLYKDLGTTKGSDAGKILDIYGNLVEAVVANQKGMVETATYLKDNNLAEVIKSEEKYAMWDAYIGKFDGFDTVTASSVLRKPTPGIAFALSKELPGGAVALQAYVQEGVKGEKAFALNKQATLSIETLVTPVKEVKEFDTLNVDQINDALTSTEAIVKAVDAAKGDLDKLVAARKAFEESIKGIEAVKGEDGKNGTDEQTKARASAVKSALLSGNSFSASVAKTVNGFAVNRANKMLNYVVLSIRAHDQKSDKA